MDKNQPMPSALSAHNFKIHPTHLWIGTSDTLMNNAERMIQHAFCASACGTCTSCLQIAGRRHPAVLWLSCQNQYTRQELEPIFSTARFSLEPGNIFFFVIDRADHLTPSGANSLLKLLEEPPMGYCFLLLAQNRDLILPTIASRCIINTVAGPELSAEQSTLHKLLSSLDRGPASEFLYALDQSKINEQETMALIDALLADALTEYKLCSGRKPSARQHAWQKRITILSYALKVPPMAGGSKLLLKDIFLRLEPQAN